MDLNPIEYGVSVQRYMVEMNGMKQLGKMKKQFNVCVNDYPDTTSLSVVTILFLMTSLLSGNWLVSISAMYVSTLSFFLGYYYQIEKNQKAMKEKAARILLKHGGLG